MKRYGILLYALTSAIVLALAACGGGGGGGGGGVGGDVPFTNAVTLPGDVGTTVSAATSINNSTPTSLEGVPAVEVVGMADDGNALGVLQPVVWTIPAGAVATPTGIATARFEDLINLGTGEFGAAFGNNENGEIVGTSEDGAAGSVVQAVHWASRTAIPTSLDPGVASAAFDINNIGLAVGERVAGVTTAAVWDTDAAPVAVGNLPVPLGTTASSASSISEATNIIVGEVTDANGVTHAAVWTPITTTPDRTDYNAPVLLKGKTLPPNAPVGTPVPTLNGDSTAVAISGNRVFGEIADTADGIIHAVVWDGILATTEPQDRGVNTFAGGMSAGGRPVGAFAGNAALLGTATPVRLHVATAPAVSPTANGGANAINSSNKAVGTGGGLAFFATP